MMQQTFLDPASGEYNCVIWEISNYGNPADDPNKEIVRATALSGSTLTLQEPKKAQQHLIIILVARHMQ